MRQCRRKQVSQPEDIVLGGPCPVAVPIQTMDSDDTRGKLSVASNMGGSSILFGNQQSYVRQNMFKINPSHPTNCLPNQSLINAVLASPSKETE